MKLVWTTVLALAAAMAFAFQPELAGSMTFWWIMAMPHVLVATYAVSYLRQQGTLAPLLRPRWGDLSLGAFVGIMLLVASWAGREMLAGVGTPQQAWLLNIYLQVGDPEHVQGSVIITVLLLCIVICEELIWRGWALDRASKVFGERRGWMVGTLIYALVTTPTIVTLASPSAGPNPLLVLAALFCGMVWTFMAHLLRRLPPVIISHAVFTYFSVVQFRQPGF